jgi:AcrR family transcriptional regulator
MDRRARKRQARHDQILDAAMAIVLRDGVDGLTLKGLAEDLDAAVGSLYRYFDGKAALLAGLQVRAVEALDASLRDLDEAMAARLTRITPRRAALVRVLVFPLGYLRHARQEAARHRLIDTVLSSPEPMFDKAQALAVEAVLSPVLARCGDSLHAAADVGALSAGPCLPRAHALWAVVHGLEHFPKRDRLVSEPLGSANLTRVALAGLLQGWGASRADARAALELAATSTA